MQLATADELVDFLEQSIPATRAEVILDIASGAILDVVPAPVDGVASTTVHLIGDGTRALLLPSWPVSAVTAVEVDGEALTSDGYRWNRSGVLERVGGHWTCSAEIVVTYDHGHAAPPDALKGICLMVAARVVANPARFQGFQAPSGGNANYGAGAASSGFELTAGEVEMIHRAMA